MKIASLVPEGTLVKQGDVVAELDRSTIANKFAEITLALQKAQAVYEQAMLDSTLNLPRRGRDPHHGARPRGEAAREGAGGLRGADGERQAEIDSRRRAGAGQAKVDYKTKTEQAQAKMREVGADSAGSRTSSRSCRRSCRASPSRAPAPAW
jgi:multidrug efflux pump subunit AcrA (membrane-fusion protein)